MAFALPMPTPAPDDEVESARLRDEALAWRRPLLVLAAAAVATALVAAAMAVLGHAAAPVDARSTSSPTAELVPSIEVVDMRPAQAVPLPPITTPVRR